MPASRSLIALLVSTVALFALYFFALKGNSSSNSSSGSGLGQYQSAINQAHQAVKTSASNDAASGNDGASASASSTPASGGASASSSTSSSSTSSSSAKSSSTSSQAAQAAKKPVVHLTPKVATHNHAAMVRLSTVQQAITKHKVVLMLFYNPQGSDDQAVKQELKAVPAFDGQVVKLSIPLSESANFTPVTQQVPVNFSPTVVLISPDGQAQEMTGLIDRFVIAERVVEAAIAAR